MVERKRHLAKALTYRVFGSLATAGIAYVATGSAALGASVGVLDSVVKVGLYYMHERIWYRIHWGVKHPDQTPVPANPEIVTRPVWDPASIPAPVRAKEPAQAD